MKPETIALIRAAFTAANLNLTDKRGRAKPRRGYAVAMIAQAIAAMHADTAGAGMTEDEEKRRGALLCEVLNLPRDRDTADRYLTTIGNKTQLGLYRIAARIVNEGK